jgi:hypothetical protein
MSAPDGGTQPTMASVRAMFEEFQHVQDRRVEEQMARSRRKGRVLGWSALVLAVLAAASTGALLYFAFYHDLPLLAAPSIRAEEVVLVDGGGTERGHWTVDEDGAGRLLFMDADGNPRLKLTVRADGEQGVSLADENGTNRVVLGFLSDRSSTLAFADSSGVTRAVLGMSPAGAASLLFADEAGGPRAALGLSPNGEPTFWWPELDVTDESSGGP